MEFSLMEDTVLMKNNAQRFLKEKSPSCGVNRTYVNGRLQEGKRVTAALLSRHNLRVIGAD
jgi:uncharacterized protein YbbK (DUF523 family)